MIGVLKTILIIIGLWVVVKVISRLILSSPFSQNRGDANVHRRNDRRKKDKNNDDGEYVDYEEVK